MGTDKNIPNTPHTAPQKAKATKMTRGLRFSDCPRTRGSTKLPRINWMLTMPQLIIKQGNHA